MSTHNLPPRDTGSSPRSPGRSPARRQGEAYMVPSWEGVGMAELWQGQLRGHPLSRSQDSGPTPLHAAWCLPLAAGVPATVSLLPEGSL